MKLYHYLHVKWCMQHADGTATATTENWEKSAPSVDLDGWAD